jgi:hypothetical protein
MNLSKLGLTPDCFSSKGQLVFVINSDNNFRHDQYLRARLRLFYDVPGQPQHTFSDTTSRDIIPVLAPFPNQRVIIWIVALSQNAPDNFIIYWDDTLVKNWLGMGLTAEFRWQPTSEVIEDLYKKDVVDHIAWLGPMMESLQNGVKKGWVKKVRKVRAQYEEDADWGPEMIE